MSDGHDVRAEPSETLARELRRAIAEVDDLTRAFSAGGGAATALAGKLCSILVRYCGYELAPLAEPFEPFDDPYVGAAILTASGRLLGSHRKQQRHERHAEVEAILEALHHARTQEATALRDDILSQFEMMSWLRSDAQRSAFCDLFGRAGVVLRREAKEPLVLVSTLEPCRDFATQPGCSALIASLAPAIVLYGSDDTNAKGQGRVVLEKAGIPVRPNLAVEENVRVNLLFYTAIHKLRSLIARHGSSRSFALQYSLASLDDPPPSWGINTKDGRLVLHFAYDSRPIYEARGAARGPELRLDSLPEVRLDARQVLFCSQLDVEWLARYLERYASEIGTLPGRIVCCDGIDVARPNAVHESYLAATRAKGIRTHLDVMRREAEYVIGASIVRELRSLRRASAELVAFARDGRGYVRVQGTPGEVRSRLAALKEVKRLEILSDPSGEMAVQELLVQCERFALFESTEKLQAASVRIHVVPEIDEPTDHAEARLASWLADNGLSARCSVGRLTSADPLQQFSARTRYELYAGMADPVTTGSDEQLTSPDWKVRRSAGRRLALAARAEPQLLERKILRPLPIGISRDELLAENQWARTCSLLNAVASHGRPRLQRDADRVVSALAQLGETVSRAADSESVSSSPTLVDIVWRLTAAASSCSTSAEELRRVLNHAGLLAIFKRNAFLAKEAFFYASRSADVAAMVELGTDIVRGATELGLNDRTSIGVRVARLQNSWPSNVRDALVPALLHALGREAAQAYEREVRCCDDVMSNGLASVLSTTDGHQRFGSYLFLRTLKAKEEGLVGAISAEFQELVPGFPQSVTWRGDKTSLARIVLSEVPARRRLTLLQALADDEDETIRWAALVLLFDPSLRTSMVREGSGCDAISARRAVAQSIDRIIAPGTHYWLQREFLSLFATEHGKGASLSPSLRVSLMDAPNGAELLAHRPNSDTHPEVRIALASARQISRRILLLLPPLDNRTEPVEPRRTTSTPALGLGAIAAALLERGHHVTLRDCHRYDAWRERNAADALSCDIVGFGVVQSTYAATRELVQEIAARREGKSPLLVLGGQAVTMNPSYFQADERFRWDFLVVGDGEVPMIGLLESLRDGVDPALPGLVARAPDGRERLLAEPHWMTVDDWESLPWVDRRIFVAPDGSRYEPAPTRSGREQEAHLVISRGCEWRCAFCTEATSRGGSEIRRRPQSVLDEVDWLVANDRVTRIQFVDDNLLPQIAVPGSDRVAGLRWTREFLNRWKSTVDRNSELGWRAIMRFEDLLAYESANEDFVNDLQAAGCRMLAFGVEYGTESRRSAAKGGSISNVEIAYLVERLHKVGILVKGYFIIGGYDENDATVDDTIRVAINSGFDIAYFALFKAFRKGVVDLRRAAGAPEAVRLAAQKFLTFDSLHIDLAKIAATEDQATQLVELGRKYSSERMVEAKRVANCLSDSGFRFSELFKYSDYHSDDSAKDLGIWQNDTTREFLSAVKRAYFEFYLRDAFLPIYRGLLRSGY